MLCGMIVSLASQQRRLLGVGEKHISFSREQGSAKAYATTTTTTTSASARSDRRRRRLTDPRQKPNEGGQQQQQKQPTDQRNSRSTVGGGSSSSAAPDPIEVKARRDQFLEHAARLGVFSASDLDSLSSGQHHSSHPERSSSSSSSHNSSQAPSPVSTFTSGDLSSSTVSNSSSGPVVDIGSSSSGRRRRSSASDPGIESNNSNSSKSRMLTAEDEAIITAMNRLGRFMDFRERCASEVLTKLAEVGCDQQLAHKVLQRMQAAGLQDDARFAEMYAGGQWTLKSQAPAKIAYELRVRRVSQEHIDAALAAVFGDSKQLAGREPNDEQQEASWEQLVEACRQRVEHTHSYPPQKRRQKLASWMQRRGHSLATAFRMFEVLNI